MYKSPPYRLFALDQDCKERMDRAYAADPCYLPAEMILPTSIQGFVLCNAGDKTPVIGFYGFPFARKRIWRMEGILRITRALPFSRGVLTAEAFSQFIREVMELGRRASAHQVEIELYRDIRSRIFFPSTNCAVNTYNDPAWTDLLEKAGFACDVKTLCYEVDLQLFRAESDAGIHVRPYRPDDGRDRDLYYDLWIRSGECPYGLAHSGFWYANAFGWPRLWYSEAASILNRDGCILFAEKDGETLGMIHWMPNLFPLLREGGRKAVFLEEASVNETLNRIGEGKIFKLAVSDRAARHRDRVERCLIGEAMRVMKEIYGFKTCQVGNVHAENERLIDPLCRFGGKKVHEVWYMRRKSA